MKNTNKNQISAADASLLEGIFGGENTELLVNTARPALSPGQKITKLDYIFNPGAGTIRWIYPQGLGRPLFLSTYNSPTRKAKVYAWIIRLCFWLKASRWVRSGTLTLKHDVDTQLPSTSVGIDQKSYSIFTGTVGPNRKAIAFLSKVNGPDSFVKIPLGKQASNQLRHEVVALDKVNHLNLKHWRVPTATSLAGEITSMESLVKGEGKTGRTITPLHLKALTEMANATSTFAWEEKQLYLIKIDQRLSLLERGKGIIGLPWMMEQLKFLRKEVSQHEIPMCFSHGDFTPWNMYLDQTQIKVYDWEMAAMRPIGYDLLHFVFQSEVLVGRKEFSDIEVILEKLRNQLMVQDLLLSHGMGMKQILQLYLLEAMTTYLLQFQSQEELHQQAYWLMKIWSAALKGQWTKNSTCRKIFLNDFTEALSPLNYAIMRGQEMPLENLLLGSDLDILVTNNGKNSIEKWVEKYPMVAKTKVFHQSFMDRLEIHFVDGGFLSLDLVHDIRRKSIRTMSASQLLARAYQDKWGNWRLSTLDQLAYGVLFYGLNRHMLPMKIVKQHQSLPLEERTLFSQKMKSEFGLEVPLSHLKRFSTKRDRVLKRRLRLGALNPIWEWPLLQFQYGMDLLRRMGQSKGMVITLSGVDGAGKSTVLEEAVAVLGHQYRRKTKVLRHRPSILPILSSLRYGRKGAEERSVASLPRQGKNVHPVSSALRFAWYYLDYFFGQWVIWLRYERRGYVVLYDRYYFDMIADPERTNFRLPVSIIRGMGKLIRKPQLNILLTAEPDVIRKRKQELSQEDIVELTHRYKNLFQRMSKRSTQSSFITLHNKSIATSVERILSAYRQAL